MNLTSASASAPSAQSLTLHPRNTRVNVLASELVDGRLVAPVSTLYAPTSRLRIECSKQNDGTYHPLYKSR